MASIRSALFVTIRVEISGYLTQKVPPKPQQTSLSRHLDQRQALDAGQELPRLRLDAELTQAGAAVVVGRGRGKLRRDLAHAHDVDQEAHQLVAAARAAADRALLHRRVVVEQLGQMEPQHPGAGARTAPRHSRSRPELGDQVASDPPRRPGDRRS